MGFLNKLFGGEKAEKITLYAPVSGEIVDITSVSDETFAQKIMGDGVAIVPANGKIYSPYDATIDNMFVFETGHAFSFKTADGVELLVHIGFDTVHLKGEHFKAHHKTGDTIKKGDLMIEVELDAVKEAGYDTTVVMVILNSDSFSDFEKTTGTIEAGSEILTLTKK